MALKSNDEKKNTKKLKTRFYSDFINDNVSIIVIYIYQGNTYTIS